MARTTSMPASAAMRRNEGRARSESSGDEEEAAVESGSQRNGLPDTELRRKAALLIRYALFSQYKHQIIRRDNITKDVLPNSKGTFSQIFAKAQSILKETYGMELVELRVKGNGGGIQTTQAVRPTTTQGMRKGKGRARLDVVEEEDEDDEEETGAAPEVAGEPETESSKEPKKAGSKTYILRSILPTAMVAAMHAPHPLPLFAANGAPVNGNHAEPDVNKYELPGTVDSGALIRLEKGDGGATGGLGLLGVRTIVLCLILCVGRIVKDDHLHALLKRLSLERETVLSPASTDTKEPALTLDKYLDRLAAQNYLEKVKIPGPEQSSYEWKWGNREPEFSEKTAAALMEKLFFHKDDGESESDEEEHRGRGIPRNRRAEKEIARKKMKEDIAKAAGGPLTGTDFD